MGKISDTLCNYSTTDQSAEGIIERLDMGKSPDMLCDYSKKIGNKAVHIRKLLALMLVVFLFATVQLYTKGLSKA